MHRIHCRLSSHTFCADVCSYVPLALNWLCWAERVAFTNFILLAEDQAAARKFRARGVPVIIDANAAESKAAMDYGSIGFQETMTYRTEFLMR